MLDEPEMTIEPKADLNELFGIGELREPAERWVWVTWQHEGIHCYPAALTDPKLAEVSFLGYKHRHIFHMKVAVTVEHLDRDVEFILLKRELQGLYHSGVLQLDSKSCEMVATDLYKYMVTAYPGRGYEIEVSEDAENGARMLWPKKEQ
jgi:hypothetical protein